MVCEVWEQLGVFTRWWVPLKKVRVLLSHIERLVLSLFSKCLCGLSRLLPFPKPFRVVLPGDPVQDSAKVCSTPFTERSSSTTETP